MKKHTKLSLFGLTIASMLLAGCGDNTTQANNGEDTVEDKVVINTEAADVSLPAKFTDKISGLRLNKNVVSLFCNDQEGSELNEKTTFDVTVSPASNAERKLVWTSSDPTVAVVDNKGEVTAIGEGRAVITVANEDGTVKDSARIVVNNMNGQRIATCGSRLNDILNAQKADNFVLPDVLGSHTSRVHTVTKNGVAINSDISYEGIVASEKNAYLDLEVISKEIRVENGSPIPEKLRYTFYTTDQYETFLFKSQGKVKNYMSVNQSSYLGKDKIEALKAVCDQFFVSGSKILTNVKSDVLSTVKTSYIQNASYNEHFGRMDEKGQLAFDLYEVAENQTADQEDFENQGIPVGTNYTFDISVRFLFENNLLTAEHLVQSYSYKIGEDEYVSRYVLDEWYTTDEEMVFPNKANYQKVDGVFDL